MTSAANIKQTLLTAIEELNEVVVTDRLNKIREKLQKALLDADDVDIKSVADELSVKTAATAANPIIVVEAEAEPPAPDPVSPAGDDINAIRQSLAKIEDQISKVVATRQRGKTAATPKTAH
jgi:hypothetical protein